jgi:hypothetical protein
VPLVASDIFLIGEIRKVGISIVSPEYKNLQDAQLPYGCSIELFVAHWQVEYGLTFADEAEL